MHLIIDGYARSLDLMFDKDTMKDWLAIVVKKVGMTLAGKPYIQGFPWPGSEDKTALTAFQPLMESGLTVHCCPEIGYIQIDLFSCSDFQKDKAIAFIVGSLGLFNYKWLLLRRGIDLRKGVVVPPTLIGESS